MNQYKLSTIHVLSLLQLLRILAENDGIVKFQFSWFLIKKEFELYVVLTQSEQLGYHTDSYPSDPMVFMHSIQYIQSRLHEWFLSYVLSSDPRRET